MPVVVDPGDHAYYGQFPTDIERDWLGRWCHLSEADVGLVRRRAGDVTRLGFAVQLATVPAIGTFLADPTAVPGPIVDSVAGQLNIGDPSILAGYRELPVRWKHTSEIRRRYSYRDFTSQPAHFSAAVALPPGLGRRPRSLSAVPGGPSPAPGRAGTPARSQRVGPPGGKL